MGTSTAGTSLIITAPSTFKVAPGGLKKIPLPIRMTVEEYTEYEIWLRELHEYPIPGLIVTGRLHESLGLFILYAVNRTKSPITVYENMLLAQVNVTKKINSKISLRRLDFTEMNSKLYFKVIPLKSISKKIEEMAEISSMYDNFLR